MQTILVELTTEVEYNHNNNDVAGTHVELKEPNGKVSHICADIDGIAQQAIAKSAALLPASVIEAAAQERVSGSSDEDEAMDGETFLKMVAAGGGDMGRMTLLFKDLFKSVGEIGGEKPLTLAIIERISYKDLRAMMGDYAVNFVSL